VPCALIDEILDGKHLNYSQRQESKCKDGDYDYDHPLVEVLGFVQALCLVHEKLEQEQEFDYPEYLYVGD
jgi:hypothetical protein